jgi:hypothetical protein
MKEILKVNMKTWSFKFVSTNVTQARCGSFKKRPKLSQGQKLDALTGYFLTK